MKTKFLKAGALGLSLLSVAIPYLALAVGIQDIPPGPQSPGALLDSVCTIAKWLFTGLIILAVVFVIYAAFKYLTAAGDPEKVKTANHVLIYAAVAVAVAVLARAIPIVVGNLVSGASLTNC